MGLLSLRSSYRRSISRFFSQCHWPVSRVRNTFLQYFQTEKSHAWYPSSPVVPPNDPSLLFTNAGMNQFKPIFMGVSCENSSLGTLSRAVNSQKCIRAGGKHNDLADVGKDTYHHTFFEMLGTWSFNDSYSSREAIDWAFELLTRPDLFGLSKDRLYVSYFGGDEELGLREDTETKESWLRHLPPDRVLPFKGVSGENFWEMGDSGPCGPCTEIHYDRVGSRCASHLVNADDPNVVEIWNLVFMQYNRNAQDGSLSRLPASHIDTGMGLERITSILQGKLSNYDTDIFDPLMEAIHKEFRLPATERGQLPEYGQSHGPVDRNTQQRDIAYRVIADHLRTATVAVADGTKLSSNGRGYVIRRMIRRALRYSSQLSAESLSLSADSKSAPGAAKGYSPSLANIAPVVIHQLGGVYPEVESAKTKIVDVIRDEEASFAVLLAKGLKFLNEKMSKCCEVASESSRRQEEQMICGQDIFYLYDTLGFPVDLTELIVEEFNQESAVKVKLDLEGYSKEMQQQKDQATLANQRHKQKARGLEYKSLTPSISSLHSLRQQAVPLTDDSLKWNDSDDAGEAIHEAQIVKVMTSEEEFRDSLSLSELRDDSHERNEPCKTFGLLLDRTSFYAEAGGQVSDTGTITILSGQATLECDVIDVQSYGGYVLHLCRPCNRMIDDEDFNSIHSGSLCELRVDADKRSKITPNHTVTHVLNLVLRQVLQSSDIDQKGSLVSDEKLRFDFTYDKALSESQLRQIETGINQVVQEDLAVHSAWVPMQEAKSLQGVRAVFGEQYPDPVRVVSVGAAPEAARPTSGATILHEDIPEFSVEFCGGTHLRSMGQAKACVLVDEMAVAKGIRRIEAVTGDIALGCMESGKLMIESFVKLGKQVEAVSDVVTTERNGATSALSDPERVSELIATAEAELNNQKEAVERVMLPITTKRSLREDCQRYQKQLDVVKKKFTAGIINSLVSSAITSRETQISECGAAVLEVSMPRHMSCDGNTLKSIRKRVEEISLPEFSYLVLCKDHDNDQVRCFASVSLASQRKGASAVSWVQSVTGAGGKGGGKKSFAQGVLDTAKLNSGSEDLVLMADRYLVEHFREST